MYAEVTAKELGHYRDTAFLEYHRRQTSAWKPYAGHSNNLNWKMRVILDSYLLVKKSAAVVKDFCSHSQWWKTGTKQSAFHFPYSREIRGHEKFLCSYYKYESSLVQCRPIIYHYKQQNNCNSVVARNSKNLTELMTSIISRLSCDFQATHLHQLLMQLLFWDTRTISIPFWSYFLLFQYIFLCIITAN